MFIREEDGKPSVNTGMCVKWPRDWAPQAPVTQFLLGPWWYNSTFSQYGYMWTDDNGAPELSKVEAEVGAEPSGNESSGKPKAARQAVQNKAWHKVMEITEHPSERLENMSSEQNLSPRGIQEEA